MPKSRSVAIIYGLNEGPFMGRKLVAALRKAGHLVVNDPREADVVIAHSGGCFIVPQPRAGQRVIMIGLPYWPGRSILRNLYRKTRQDLRTHHAEGELAYWLRKTLWNAVYFWNIPSAVRMAVGRSRGVFWTYRGVTVVRYSHDSMCTPDLTSLPFVHRPVLEELPGQHDDCWRRPDPIVNSI